mgnify:CR=1 FL=1
MHPVSLKLIREQLRDHNRKFGAAFQPIPQAQWPELPTAMAKNSSTKAVLRNRDFLVQIFVQPDGTTRLTINRTDIDNHGNWKDGITWDELQTIKNAVGYEDHDALEVYPAKKDLVNVSNMRHLWILPTPPSFIWRA